MSAVSRPLVDIRLEGVTALDAAHGPVENVTLQVRHGEFFTIVGSQRSGKSMLLRLVAGFAEPRAGRVLFEGENITRTPPGQRGIGFVFQDGALWPHLSVFEHVAFGLRAGGAPAEEVERRVPRVLSRLGLGGLEARRPDALSLDQRRRLALARALAVEPRVLLLDEPLSHLEPTARKALRLELARLHRDLAVTTLHATRDAADALALSDRIAVLVDGRVVQVGEPPELYWRPRDSSVASALGPANLLPVRVVEVRDTGPTERLWRAARGLRGLRALVIECAFPNRLEGLAATSRHLTPSLIQRELDKIPPDLPIWIFHIKPQFYQETVEQLARIDSPRIQVLEQGKTYTL